MAKFGAVGISATLVYAGLAFIFAGVQDLSAIAASLLAYGCAAIYSYFAHKTVTFMSRGRHTREGPRFVIATAIGFAIASLIPFVLVQGFGMNEVLSIITVSATVPAINWVVLSRWVFVDRD
ncbi:GtrA family protein [Aminobacter aganoensis]|uniref:Putative flippase GtrA n=1 Tax=Aminobacter aganoensis TaxID=83264 RepID=A0A7X0KNF7_9HYPH|nr:MULTISPECIES: GtrA family protein [Aminobacter]KQU74469.1 hypothetical protein ASC75_20825 [Aminobacter sp. DSM 101952]MBB6357121.1 putative flippase GtrA [Aminobacter aganoensis]